MLDQVVWRRAHRAFFALTPILSFALAIILLVSMLEPTSLSALQALSAEGGAPVGPTILEVEPAKNAVYAVVMAKSKGTRIEVLSERTEVSTTWANPDGTFTTESFGSPIRIKDENGTDGWRTLDFDLEVKPDGTVGPKSGYLPVTLSGEASAEEVATTGLVSIAADAKSNVEFGWDGALPEPVLDGATATYEDVLPNVDLVVELTSSGSEQFFVLKTRPNVDEKLELRLPLQADRLDVQELDNGSVQFTNDDDELIGTVAPPLVWDSSEEGKSGLPINTTGLEMALATGARGPPELVITPAASFLSDPDLVYPVIIDPSYSGAPTVDTYVRSDYPTTTYATYDPTELQVGTYNSGTTKARSYLNFSASSWKGADVTAATLKLYLFHSYNCTASKMYVYPAGLASNSTNWNNKPSMNTSYSGSITTSKGYSACAAGYANINVLNVADYLASTNASTVGMGLKALSETDNTSWKRFNSANASSNKPSLSVTYNRYPSTATTPTLAPSVVVGSDTFATSVSPTFSSSTTEPDGSTTKVTFEVYNAATMSASTLVSSCTTPLVASGATASCSVPTALTDGVSYWVRALGNDGTLAAKAWSAAHKFTVITSAPQTPTISCPSPYTDGSWNASLPTAAVSCTVTVASSTAGGAATSLSITKDSGTPSVFPLTRGAGTTESVSVSVSKGSHTIQAVTTSSAGTRGVSTYTFGYGTATLSSPTAGFKTTDTVRVTAEAPPAGTADVDVSVHWRVAGTSGSAWNESDQAIIFTSTAEGVKVPGSLWHTQSAVVDETGGSPVELSSRTPVVLELQVCVTYTPGGRQCTADEDAPLTVLRVPHAFGAGFPTAEAGPGQVALWTGEFNLSETDVTVPTPEGGLSISRAHSTFAGPITDISKPNQAFGPGWIASFDGSGSGAASFEIVDNTTLDGTFALIDEEGVPLVYRQPGEGRLSAPEGVYEPVDHDTAFLEAVLEVTGTGTSRVLTLTELDGTVTTWHTGSTTNPLEWVPVSVAEPGGLGTTSYTVNAQNQITRILAPQPEGVTSCTTMVAGCRALNIEYAVTSTANSGTPGNIAGQVTQISFIVYDPDKTSGGSPAPGINTVVVARYTYYSNGRLATVTDPRSGLGTSYQYQVDGSDVTHLTRLVNAGLAGFDFSYETDTVAGVRLKSVSRDGATSSAPSSVVSSYVYGIDPTTATTGLPALAADDVTAWQQAAAPTYGAAEFGPDHPVSTTNPANLTANDWKYASLQYTDAEGYTVNTGEYGAGAWQLSATDYDDTGNVIRTFDNRAIAAITAIYTGTPIAVDQYASLTQFNPAFSIYDAATASTVNVPARMFVTDAWSPARDAVVNGTLQSARVHTHYDYDEGAPHSGIDTSVAGAPRRWGLVTTATTGAASPTSGSTTAGVSAPADLAVISVSQSGYGPIDSGVDDSDASGWRLGSATVQTTVMPGSGKDITTKSRYDTTGGLLEYRAPLSVGSDEASVLSTDYTAGTNTVNAKCGNKPEWAGMPCWSGTAAAPVGDDLPDTMTTKYTMWLASAETTETSGSTASEVVRTTTTNYLADGRTESGHTVITGTTADQPELLSRTVYDSATGMPTGTQQVNASNVVVAESTASYDLRGREISSTNSLGDVATTVYVAPGQPGAGQIASYTDAKGTVTYTYDGTDALGNSEQRGLVTAMTVSGVGAYTAAYDDQASMLLQTAPGGLSQTFTYDQVGQLLTQSYVGPTPATGDPWVLEWSLEYNLSGQVVSERAPSIDLGGVTGTDPTHKYSYDRAGRLIQTLDRSGDNGCVVRLYEFDKQGNRTSLSTTNPDATGACNSGTTTTKAWTYDLSSRVLTAGDGVGGYEYDLLGRVTSMPEADAPVSDAAGDNPVTMG